MENGQNFDDSRGIANYLSSGIFNCLKRKYFKYFKIDEKLNLFRDAIFHYIEKYPWRTGHIAV